MRISKTVDAVRQYCRCASAVLLMRIGNNLLPNEDIQTTFTIAL